MSRLSGIAIPQIPLDDISRHATISFRGEWALAIWQWKVALVYSVQHTHTERENASSRFNRRLAGLKRENCERTWRMAFGDTRCGFAVRVF